MAGLVLVKVSATPDKTDTPKGVVSVCPFCPESGWPDICPFCPVCPVPVTPSAPVIGAPAVIVIDWKRARERLRKNQNNARYQRRLNDGIRVLKITAYLHRAETFARRYCGLTGRDPTEAQIEQAITDFVNRKGA
jgi:hypothetical protein